MFNTCPQGNKPCMTRYIMAQDKKRRTLQVLFWYLWVPAFEWSAVQYVGWCLQPNRSPPPWKLRVLRASHQTQNQVNSQWPLRLRLTPVASSHPSLHSAEPSSVEVGVDSSEIKEEIDFSPEVETCDLLDIEEAATAAEGAEFLAPEASQPSQGVDSIAPAEATEPSASIEVGAGPSAKENKGSTRR